MEEVIGLCRKIIRLMKVGVILLSIPAGLALLDSTRQYIHETAEFSKYIEIEGSAIEDARMVGEDLLFTHDFKRTVRLRDSYDTKVLTEYICKEGGNKKNTVSNWLLDKEGNPGVVTRDVKISDVNIKPGYTCRANWKFTVEPNGYPITTTRRSKDFIVK